MDATVGFININQNKIIKIFGRQRRALLPPTLVASIYGMNTRFRTGFHGPDGQLSVCRCADDCCCCVRQRRRADVVFRQEGAG